MTIPSGWFDEVALQSGTFDVTTGGILNGGWFDVTYERSAASFVLGAALGSYVLSGGATGEPVARKLAADRGSYVLTGSPVTFDNKASGLREPTLFIANMGRMMGRRG